jgi:mitochondrial intermembrane space import and assembly protein 40
VRRLPGACSFLFVTSDSDGLTDLLNPNLDAIDDDSRDHSTLEALTSHRAQRADTLHAAADALSSENASTTVVAEHDIPVNTGAADLEEEAAGEGAFNPETGEINWDCPCLGGMAHGPCGPEFREAFSCFVYSTEEPKGMDCIDKFQNMQQCFQKYPEVYKGELEDDEELSAGLEAEKQELVNEIAERKKQQADSASQRRLLEEPDTSPKPSRIPKQSSDTSTEGELRTGAEVRSQAPQSEPPRTNRAADATATSPQATHIPAGVDKELMAEPYPPEAFDATPKNSER